MSPSLSFGKQDDLHEYISGLRVDYILSYCLSMGSVTVQMGISCFGLKLNYIILLSPITLCRILKFKIFLETHNIKIEGWVDNSGFLLLYFRFTDVPDPIGGPYPTSYEFNPCYDFSDSKSENACLDVSVSISFSKV